jgi:hypothetical protein
MPITGTALNGLNAAMLSRTPHVDMLTALSVLYTELLLVPFSLVMLKADMSDPLQDTQQNRRKRRSCHFYKLFRDVALFRPIGLKDIILLSTENASINVMLVDFSPKISII